LVTTLAKSDASGLSAIDWHPPEEFTVKAADGITDLYGVLYRPHDFDPAKRYPVVDNIYNGPQTTWVPRTFANGVGIGAQAMAQLGFVVFVVDGRGTPERGKAFQDVVYGNFGRNEIPDHVAALRALAKDRPYLDLTRVGVTGGSFGGYMTIRAMLLAPEVYHVGVARAPVVDLYDANVERYMGLPQEHRDAYEYGSSLRLAGNLRGKLLLIHGSNDINATFSATMKLVEAFARAGRPYDLIILPEQDHALNGVSAAYSSAATNRYLVEHLKP
jgi:dipeptidyl aminopeptidase/acylaminoacyl peptidase